MPVERRSDLEAEMEMLDLDPFQRFCALLTDLRRDYDVRSPEEKVHLMRKLEHPMDWLRKIDGKGYKRELLAWIRACTHASTVHPLAWDRIVLGVHELHRHIMDLNKDKIQESKMARWFCESGVEAYIESPAHIYEYSRAIAFFCSKSRDILNKTARGEGKPEARSTAADRPETTLPERRAKCYVCKKPRTAHADGRFCPPKPLLCNVCGKAPSEHPPTKRYPKGQFCAGPNGKSPS
jgi:hypothetical protein